MTLAILGGSNLATALGNKYIGRGMKVVFGLREGFSPRQIAWKMLKMQNHNMLGFQEAIENADVIFICCENEVLPAVCQAINEVDTMNKLFIDCTNGKYDPELGCNTTYIQNLTNNPTVFKAFNNLGLDYPKSDPLELVKETYFCGDGLEHRVIIKRLIELIGFKAIDAGKLKNACLLEAVYHLRREISHVKNGQGDFHFKLMSV
jgi:8-hydroxy-5-deazaflavin:NADPH oxidoreductase